MRRRRALHKRWRILPTVAAEHRNPFFARLPARLKTSPKGLIRKTFEALTPTGERSLERLFACHTVFH
jgi:hypothetical protein